MTKEQNETVGALKRAAKGLRMPSETDMPFEVFAWDDAGKLTPKGMAIEESSLDELFATVPSEDKGTFQELQQVIQAQLSVTRGRRVVVQRLGRQVRPIDSGVLLRRGEHPTDAAMKLLDFLGKQSARDPQ